MRIVVVTESQEYFQNRGGATYEKYLGKRSKILEFIMPE